MVLSFVGAGIMNMETAVGVIIRVKYRNDIDDLKIEPIQEKFPGNSEMN